jgi:hypothetical protein
MPKRHISTTAAFAFVGFPIRDVPGRRSRQNRRPPQHAVEIELRLRRKSPENGNIRGRSWRLFPKRPASSPIWEFRDRRLIAKARQQWAFLAFEGFYLWLRNCMAGAGGFEPPHGGIKIHCLTTWRRPNNLSGKRRDDSRADSLWQRRSIGGVEPFQPAKPQFVP